MCIIMVSVLINNYNSFKIYSYNKCVYIIKLLPIIIIRITIKELFTFKKIL